MTTYKCFLSVSPLFKVVYPYWKRGIDNLFSAALLVYDHAITLGKTDLSFG